MRNKGCLAHAGLVLGVLVLLAASALAQTPAPKEASWTARDFKFHTGEVMPSCASHYTTVGEPTGEPVLVLHGTTGSAASMLSPGFRRRTVRARTSRSTPPNISSSCPTPSATANRRNPPTACARSSRNTTTTTWCEAQYRLVKEGLGISHLRLVIGNSMGGMHTWMWGTQYPDFMDALVPMASQPTEMSSRNWMLRRLIIDTIRTDPDWNERRTTRASRAR